MRCIVHYYSGPFVQRRTGLRCVCGLACGVFSSADSNQSNQTEIRDSLIACADVDSLAIRSAPETTGVVNFVSEACEQVDALGTHYAPSSYIVPSADFQNLKEYFRRPVWFAGGTIPLGTRGRFQIRVFDNFSNHIVEFWPQGLDRLLGVYGFRFKMVFTLTVASTPFQQGVLAMSWQYGNTIFAGQDYDRARLSATCTNLPHVRLDVSNSTMVQLAVPFLYTGECLPVNALLNSAEQVPYGSISLNSILPVESVAGAAAPQFRLALHLEDLELVGASPFEAESVTVQAGGLVEKEVKAIAHPYSTVGYALAGGLRWVARGVPALSSLAGTTAWMLEKASGVARAFGYSKPQILDPMHRVARFECVGEQNVDQPSATLVVGPFSGNRLAVDTSVGASDVDEMALKYVLSRWSQVCVFPFTAEVARDSVLYLANCSPRALWFREFSSTPAANMGYIQATSSATSNSFLPSHLFYVGTTFRQWRGGFRFRFTFAKTKFHGGRVIVSFNPHFGSVPLSGFATVFPAAASQPTAYSTVFDLRDDNVFEFEVPYTSSSPFLSIGNTIGTMTMRVVDQLLAPEMVASVVKVMVEVQAMDDFEFAVPCGPTFAPHVLGEPVPQAFAPAHTISERACERTTGECVTSLKQLIMLPHKKRVSVTTTGTELATVTLPPFWYQPIPSTAVPPPTLTGTAASLKPMSLGYAGYFSKCYLYARGGQDVHVEFRAQPADTAEEASRGGSAATRVSATYWNYNNAFNLPPASLGRPRPSRASLPAVYGTNHIHARFPAYMKGVRARTSVYDAVGWDPSVALPPGEVIGFAAPSTGDNADRSAPEAVPIIEFANSAPTAEPVTHFAVMSRSAADDAMLAHYVGPPPLWLPATASTNSTYDPDDTFGTRVL